jgi:periplasmic protein TonB
MSHLFLFSVLSAFALLAQSSSGRGGGGSSNQPPAPGSAPPRVVHKSEPEYTKEALEAKLEGFVMLSITVGLDGTAGDIQVVKGLGAGLDEKAVECLKTWRFIPAVRNGEPTAVKARVEIRFMLPG